MEGSEKIDLLPAQDTNTKLLHTGIVFVTRGRDY